MKMPLCSSKFARKPFLSAQCCCKGYIGISWDECYGGDDKIARQYVSGSKIRRRWCLPLWKIRHSWREETGLFTFAIRHNVLCASEWAFQTVVVDIEGTFALAQCSVNFMAVCCQTSPNVSLGILPWSLVWSNHVAWLLFAAPKELNLKETIMQKPWSASRIGGTRSNYMNLSQFAIQLWAYLNDGWGYQSLQCTLFPWKEASKDDRRDTCVRFRHPMHNWYPALLTYILLSASRELVVAI
jgi:hypothetical protein